MDASNSLHKTFDKAKGRSRDKFSSFLVVIMALMVYANSLENGFVWDDANVIAKNQVLRQEILPLFSKIDVARDIEMNPYYRPLTLFTFLVEERLHGLTVLYMHLINVLLHAANAFLVYKLARSIIYDNYAALLAGLLFAIHPLGTEAVNFLAGGRNTLLSCFFILMTYLSHSWSILHKKTSIAFAGAGFFFAALFSKETSLAILPFVVSLEFASLRSYASNAKLKAVARLFPYAICAAVYFVLRHNALSQAGIQIDIFSGLMPRLLNNLYIIPRYILTIIWPLSVSPRYVIPDDLHLLALPLAAAWFCIISMIVWLFAGGRSKAVIFGLFWLVFFWLPVSGIVSIPSAPLADRYLYLPAIGLWIIIADQFVRLLSHDGMMRRYAAIGAVIVLMLLAVLTVSRNQAWKSDITLFSRYVAQYPDQAGGHHNLGCAYLDQVGDLDAAEREFEKALALDPQFPRLRTQMGYIQLLRGNNHGAIHHYNEAIEQNSFDAEAYLNRATALDRLGKYGDAVADYKRFLAIPGEELSGARPQAAARVRELSK
ncbi:MAG: tetratricopeptide repeat protein [Nitrospirae bacterium]|nr:tetratricopeptide repeat protein [Nitrospirota bacterium]